MNLKVYMHYGLAYPELDSFSNRRVGASDNTTEGTKTLDEAKAKVCELAKAHYSGQMGFPDELTWQEWPGAYTKDDPQYLTFGDTIEKQYLRNDYDTGNFYAVCRLSREFSNDGGMAYALLAWCPDPGQVRPKNPTIDSNMQGSAENLETLLSRLGVL